MGVVKRQGIKSGIIGYLGIILGFVGTLWVYPLDFDRYGYIQKLIATATLLVPILRVGSVALITKFFAQYHSEGNKGFLTFICKVTGATILTSTLTLFIVTSFIDINIPVFDFINFSSTNFYLIYLLAILMILVNILKLNASNYLRIVVPEIFDNIGLKVTLFIIVITSFVYKVDLILSVTILLIYYIFHIISLLLYNKHINALKFKGCHLSNISLSLKESMKSYWLFAGLNFFGTILSYKIDVIMIGDMIDDSHVGYYSAIMFMTIAIQIPLRSILNISSPIISKSIQQKDYDNVIHIYSKSSINLLIVGVFLFSSVYLNLENITNIMTNGKALIPYLDVFLFLGLAKLFDVSTSVNNLVMIYSKWYKYNLWLLLFTGVINIGLNYFLIKQYGIIGAAIATAISLFIFNFIKTIIVYFYIDYQPFTKEMLIPFAVLVLVILNPYKLDVGSGLMNIIINGAILTLIYVPLIYYSKISKDINGIVENTMNKLFNNGK